MSTVVIFSPLNNGNPSITGTGIWIDPMDRDEARASYTIAKAAPSILPFIAYTVVKPAKCIDDSRRGL